MSPDTRPPRRLSGWKHCYKTPWETPRPGMIRAPARGGVPRLHAWDRTLPHEPCYICAVALPGVEMGGNRYDAVICLLSLLAPCMRRCRAFPGHGSSSGVLALLSACSHPVSGSRGWKLASLIESSFGFTRLSNEVLSTPLPDLVPHREPYGWVKPGSLIAFSPLFDPEHGT